MEWKDCLTANLKIPHRPKIPLPYSPFPLKYPLTKGGFMIMNYGFFSHTTYLTHIAVFLGLIAMGVGYFVCVKAKSAEGSCPKWGKFLGTFITVVAALGLICTFYLSVKRCYFSSKKADWHQQHMEMISPSDDGDSK